MAQPPQTGGHDVITPGGSQLGFDQGAIDRARLMGERVRYQEAERKRRQKALDDHLSQYESDPVSRAMATLEFEQQEADSQRKEAEEARKKERDEIVSQYDDPVMQAWELGKRDLEKTRSLPQKQAFADREAIEALKKRDEDLRNLERRWGDNAFVMETIGAAINVVPDLAAVPARAAETVGLVDQGTTNELYRQSAQFQQSREEGRSDDMSPWLSRMYGGAAQSAMQMAATPGGGMAKIVGSGVMSGNQALTTAEDAGLKGNDRLRYAATQGLFEAGIAALGQKLFGPGVESRLAGQTVAAQTWKQLAKNIGTDALKEMPEEAVTSILQDLSSKFEGVSPDLSVGDFIQNATEAAVQAAMMSGMANVPNAARMAIQGQQPPIPPAVAAFAEKPSVPNYEAAVKAGMPPLETPNRKGRAQAADDLRKQRAPPVAQETPSGVVPDSEQDWVDQQLQGFANEEITDQGEQGRQVQPEGQQEVRGQEGLLTPETVQQPPADPQAAFEAEYRDTHAKLQEVEPDAPEAQPIRDRMADLYDMNPEVADAIEATLPQQESTTPPDIAPGAASPDQPPPSTAGPVSETEPTTPVPKKATPLLKEALNDWKGDPATLQLNLRNAVQGRVEGHRNAKRAQSLLDEVETAELNPIPLYRGDSQQVNESLLGATSDRAIAEQWAKRRGGSVTEVPAGTVKAIRIGEYEGVTDLGENEWIFDARKAEQPAQTPVPGFLALPQKSQDLFNKAFESKDVDSLKQMVAKNNVAWNAEFQSRTGIKLPRNLKDRHQVVAEWAAKPLVSTPGPQNRTLAGNIADNPSTDSIWSQIVAEAKRLGIGHNGDSKYKSQAGSRYLSVGRMRDGGTWNDDLKVRVSSHGSSGPAGPKEIHLTTTQTPDELRANIALAFERMAALKPLVSAPEPQKPDKSDSAATKPAKPEKTQRGQNLLPGMEGRAEENGRQEFVSKHQSPLRDEVREIVDDEESLDKMLEPVGNILKAVWNGELKSHQDLFDTDSGDVLWTALSSLIEYHAPYRKSAAIEDMAEQAIRRAFKEREESKPKAEKPAPTVEDDPRAALRAKLREEMAKKVAEKPAATPKATKPPKKSKPPAFEPGKPMTRDTVFPSDKPKSPAKAEAEDRTQKARERKEAAAEAIRQKLKGMMSKPPDSTAKSSIVPIDPEMVTLVVDYAIASVDLGISKFREFVIDFKETFGLDTARALAPSLEEAWGLLPEFGYEADSAGDATAILGEQTKPAATGWNAVPSHFAQQLVGGKDYKSISEARKEAGEIVGQPIKPGTANAKTLDEAIEHGIVQAGRTIVEQGGTAAETFDRLVDLYERQPVLGVRDTTSMEMQAYSTPVPLAFLASHLGGVDSKTTVYEPTAGNGMLLIGTDIKNAYANELDPDRAKILRNQGFTVTTDDAATKTPPKVQVVLANPPFGRVKGDDGQAKEFNVGGLITKEIDHAIALQALQGMQPDGHTVLILAAKGHNVKTDLERRQAYSKGNGRQFYDALYQGYDVTNHFTVDGSLYSRQGASFPVDVIVLRPLGTVRADQKRSTPWAVVPRIFNSWGEIRNAFFSDMANSGGGTGVLTGSSDNRNTDLSARDADSVGRVPGQDENASPVAAGDVRPGESEPVVSTSVVRESGRRRGGTKSGGPRSQSGLSPDAASQRSGEVDVPNANEAATTSEGVASGTRSDRMVATGAAESGKVDPESHQAAYQPSSSNKTVETLIPTNLQDATRKALERVEDEYGSVDEFVQNELGYQKNDPYMKDMSAEQVDAIALAIYAHKNGSGMVVGDMTGTGKGRVAAAMMRYAEKQGLVPLFITEKPDLFADIYRDIGDIGSDTPDSPFIALTTNDTSGSHSIDLPNGRKLQSSSETNQALFNEGLASLADGNGFVVTMGGKPTKVNAVFTMYSQLQTVKGAETLRRDQIRRLMPNAYLIMDESHNAGGTVKERVDENAPPDMAAYAREIVQAAPGVIYLSATFAKRPDVMDLYSKTDMAKAVDGDITKLAGVVQAGGLPLQQVLSAMLGESGQYIRREKSFDGIEFSNVDVGVNLEEQDRITEIFREIRSFDAVVQEVVTGMAEAMTSAGQSAMAGDISTGDAGLTSTSFSSILWNAVDQMLFALKADKAADEAIAAWKNGEVPILAVDNTMESILDEYVTANNLAVGDAVKLSFRDVLHRYLERSRWITVDTGERTERNKKITRKERLTDADLNVETDLGNALEQFRQAYAKIEATTIDAPASPIDWIRYRMQKAGMKIAEVTGRKAILVYNDNNAASLAARPKTEAGTRGKQETIRRINDGSLDAMILNRSGATGLSVHASAKVKNQKVRHMLIVQPAKNIDEFMQMLGRVNRTGQVVKPRYGLLKSDSPAESRPAAVLSKKLASLNASVTAKSKGAVGFNVTDVMNEVGGAIVQQYLIDNPEFARALDMEMEAPSEAASEPDSLEDIVRKATGRSAILPIAQQREFWDDITAAYNARIEELNALNANPLIAQTMDLDAKTLTSINLFAGKPDEGPFAAPADIEQINIKSPGKPMKPEQVLSRIQDFYDIDNIDARHGAEIKWASETRQKLMEEVGPYREQVLSRVTTDEARTSRTEMLDRQLRTIMTAVDDYSPGTVIQYIAEGMTFEGVVMGFHRTGKTGNPVAPSRWVIDVAINDPAKKLNIPVSQSRNLSPLHQSLEGVLRQFETAQTTSRQKRWIGTGNLVAAYAQLAAQNGKLIFYTDDQGNTKRGILMPQAFSANQFLEKKPVPFTSASDMLEFFAQGGTRLVTADGVLHIVMRDGGVLTLVAPRARSRGGKYTLNRSITNAAQEDFVTVGSQMTVKSRNRQNQLAMLDAVRTISPVEARLDSDREVARDVLRLTKTGEKIEAEETEVASEVTEPTAEQEPADTSQPMTPARRAALKAREELRELQEVGLKYIKDMRDEWDRIVQGGVPTSGGIPLTAEMSKAITGWMFNSFRRGVKQFEVVIRELQANLDEQMLAGLKPALIRTWNLLRQKYPELDEATPEAFDAALQTATDEVIEASIEAVQAETGEAPEPEEESDEAPFPPDVKRTYSTQNAYTDRERPGLGMPERVPPARLEREPSIAAAEALGKTEYGRRETDRLIKELLIRPRAVTPAENDSLLYRRAELSKNLDAALRAKIAAGKSGDDVQQSLSDLQADDYRKQSQELIGVLETIGTAAGRALQARQAVVDEEFTLERMALEYEAAYGKPPSTEQLEKMQQQIDDLNADKAALQKLRDEQAATIDDLQTKLKEAHDALIASQAAKGPAGEPTKRTSKQRAQEHVDAAWEELKNTLKFGQRTKSLIVPYADTAVAMVKLAGAYVELGVVSLPDFLSRVRDQMGADAEPLIPHFTQGWHDFHAERVTTEQSDITDDLDILDPDSIGRVARNLHSFVIARDGLDGSAEGREAAVNAVHEILADFVPGITGGEVARMMSGIGIYSHLSQDAIEVIRRDQKAQLLLLEQIGDWKKAAADEKNNPGTGKAPPATGQERPPVSDEQRALRKAVNEAKKDAGIVEASPGQLRSALDAAKRMARNRITDLTKALTPDEYGNRHRIKRNQKILKDDGSPEFAKLTELRAERARLQKLYDEAFGRPELSDEQRIDRAEKALDRAIADLESDLKAGTLYKGSQKPRPTSPAIEAKQAVLDALKANRDELRLSSGEAQARSDAAYERSLRERDARLAQRIADNDFKPAPKKEERKQTPEMLKLGLSIQKKKQILLDEYRKWQFDQRHPIVKAWVKGPKAGMAMIRKGLTGQEQSLIGRQGWLLGITHPILYGKAARKAFASNPVEARSIFPTEQDLFNTEAELDADENWVRLEKIAKLAVTGVHGGMKKTEENNQDVPEWFDKVWGVGGSERAGSAFINTQRRTVFRELAGWLAKKQDVKGPSSLSSADLRLIGNLVNNASGRADLGKLGQSIELATKVFFSPRWWKSRINILIGQPLWYEARWTGGEGASAEARKLVALEWGKQAAAQVAIIGLAATALRALLGPPGDDEEWDWYWNWSSPYFGNIRIGSTYIDMTAGLAQHVSILGRLITGQQIARWETTEVDKFRMMINYGRGKLAPVPGIFADWLDGQSIGRDKFGSPEWALSKVSPLIFQDVVRTFKQEGIPLGALASTLMFFGMGAKSREAEIKARKDTANEVRALQKQGKPQAEIDALLNEHLKNAAKTEAKEALRTAEPEAAERLEKIVAGDESPELTEAIQKERGDITLMASEQLSSEDKRKQKSPDSDAAITTARNLLLAIAPTYEEANRLYTEGYKRRNGSTMEVVGGQFVTKKNVAAARRRIKALYATK